MEKDNVIEFPVKEEPHFNVFALCIVCLRRWIATVPHSISLFKMECPACGAQESFATFIPEEYIDAHGE